MDSTTLSLLLSFGGFVLGFIAAYGQLKSYAMKLFHSGAEAAKRWATKRKEKIEILSSHPSALIAHITMVGLSVISIPLYFYLAFYIIMHLLPNAPKTVGITLFFVAGFVDGVKVGALNLLLKQIKARIFTVNKQLIAQPN